MPININDFWPESGVQGHFFGITHPMVSAKYYEQDADMLAANNATVERFAQLYNRSFDSFKHCQLDFTDHVVVVESVAQTTSTVVADSMVTNNPDVSLLMLTADCVPLMLYDPIAKVIGLVHVSRLNVHLPILENTLAAMQNLGAKTAHIKGLIGPYIAQCNFEIWLEFGDAMCANYPMLKSCFAPNVNPQKTYLDVGQATKLILAQSGVADVQDIGCDTYPENNGYFSYRRNTHQGAQTPWRNVSIIGLTQVA